MGKGVRNILVVATMAVIATWLGGCGDSFESGDPKQLVQQGWERFRLDEFDLADRCFASAAHALEEKAKAGALAPEDQRTLGVAYFGRGIVLSLRRPSDDVTKANSRVFFEQAIAVDPKSEVAGWAGEARIRDAHLPVRSDTVIDSSKLQAQYQALEKEQAGTPAALEAFVFRMSLLVKSLEANDARKAIDEIDAFMKTYRGMPYRSPLYALKARACETVGDYKTSLAALISAEQSKELDPKNPNMDKALDYYQIGLCAEYDVGDFRTARKYYQMFLDNYPVDQKAFIVERELKRMDMIEAAGGDVKAAGDLGIAPPNSGGGGIPMRPAATQGNR